MPKFLGEEPVDLAATDYANYTPADWALHWIGMYGQIDGHASKTRVLDSAARLLNGVPMTITRARWDDGQTELRFHIGEPNEAYLAWVREQLGDYDEETGEYEYEYDDGR
jgi:hypothetical protein